MLSEQILYAEVGEGVVVDVCAGKGRIEHVGGIFCRNGAEEQSVGDNALVIGKDGLAPYKTGLGSHDGVSVIGIRRISSD